MNVPVFLAAGAAKPNEMELLYVWRQATPEGKAVIYCLLILSIVAWSVMIAKAVQMRRAKKLNLFFNTEYRTQKNVLDLFDRRVQVEGCPLFTVYQGGSLELDARLKNPDGNGRKRFVSLKGMEHVKRTLENNVAQESPQAGVGADPAGDRGERRAVPGPAGDGVGRDEHVRPYRAAGRRDDGRHGARRVSGADHHGGRPAGGHPLHVCLQLAGAQPARDDGGTGQLRAGTGVEDGDGVP